MASTAEKMTWNRSSYVPDGDYNDDHMHLTMASTQHVALSGIVEYD